MQNSSLTKKVLLIILDGFGLRQDSDYNAIKNAKMPNLDRYIKNYAAGAIEASGEAVGLPNGQFGNSEVGHLNIGAGRIVMQDITRVDKAINQGKFGQLPELLELSTAPNCQNIHILGLLSDGGVHAHINHIFELIKVASAAVNINNVFLHMFLDGRDTPPQSALRYLEALDKYLVNYPKVKLASLGGRYYAMDRDKRYDRVKLAYDAIVNAKAEEFTNWQELIKQQYALGINDEFIPPHVAMGYSGISKGDAIIIANYRADRVIQITSALSNNNFDGFEVQDLELTSLITMTCYDNSFKKVKVLFKPNSIKNTLGEYLASKGLHQLRVAETEKYPHVTYFFNGGNKQPSLNEAWKLVASPKEVATYDQKPEMSLPQVSENIVKAIQNNEAEVIITNFANGDMVGHSGVYNAAIAAVEALDIAIGECVSQMLASGGEVIITADHGNCEQMYDYIDKQPHTQHTSNLVPFIYIGRPASIKPNGALRDVAPSLLAILGLDSPMEMTGKSLIEFNHS